MGLFFDLTMTKNIERIPFHSADLIHLLNEAFPVKCIGPQDRIEDAHRYAGKREVVDLLLRKLTESDQTLLKE